MGWKRDREHQAMLMQPRVRDAGTFLSKRHAMSIQTSKRMPIGDESIVNDLRLRFVFLTASHATCCDRYAHASLSSYCTETIMIGAPAPLEIANKGKLCEDGGPMFEFLPLVTTCRDSIPSFRLARHLTLRGQLHSALYNWCIAGMPLQKSASPKLRDAIPHSEPHSNARSRQDLRPRCSTVLRMSLYFENQEDLPSSLQHGADGVLWRPWNTIASTLRSAQHPTRLDATICTMYRFPVE